jgi:hypothetical protein
MSTVPNKRGAGKGGLAVLWRAGRAWPALPDRERSVDVAFHTKDSIGMGCRGIDTRRRF